MASSGPDCPVSALGFSSSCSSEKANESACPLGAHDSSDARAINPLTCMPYDSDLNALSNSSPLMSRERESSTIPRSDACGESWKYPSSQMFYSALVRKGMPAPIESIDMMVAIHNELNENVWQQILQWEKSREPCLCPEPKLKRFRGRPHDFSPKARLYSWFGITRPFDRHDWIVDRCGQEVRYVIDYYAGHPEPDGSPTMNVDIRPALDSLEAFRNRLYRAWQELKSSPPFSG